MPNWLNRAKFGVRTECLRYAFWITGVAENGGGLSHEGSGYSLQLFIETYTERGVERNFVENRLPP